MEIIEVLLEAKKVITFTLGFIGFGSLLMGHKIIVFILKFLKSRYCTNQYVSIIQGNSQSVELTSIKSSKVSKQKKSYTNKNEFVRILTIIILSMYFIYMHIYLAIVYFESKHIFYKELTNFMDFLTLWAGISLAYYFFTKTDSFITEALSRLKRK